VSKFADTPKTPTPLTSQAELKIASYALITPAIGSTITFTLSGVCPTLAAFTK
jgi:hypothetical protein